MAKKKRQISKKVVVGIIGLIIISSVFISLSYHYSKNTSKDSYPTISHEESLLIDAAVWYPSAAWTQPTKVSKTTTYGVLDGEEINAKIKSDNAMIDHFEMVESLKKDGYLPDPDLSADGPGSSQWGYKKTTNNSSSILTFSYETEPTNSSLNRPLEFDCPCNININVFSSNPFVDKN